MSFSFHYVEGKKVRLLNDNVLVVLDRDAGQTKGGIFLVGDPEPVINGRFARVVAVGPGPSYRRMCEKCGQPRDAFPMTVRVGERVVVADKHAGEIVHLNGKEHRIVREAELLCGEFLDEEEGKEAC